MSIGSETGKTQGEITIVLNAIFSAHEQQKDSVERLEQIMSSVLEGETPPLAADDSKPVMEGSPLLQRLKVLNAAICDITRRLDQLRERCEL